MLKYVTILSIDGGGIRGIIPATILAEIEKRTGARIVDLFQLIAGTSTGAIVGLALSIPDEHGRPRHRAEDVVENYRRFGKTIFPTPGFLQDLESTVYGPKFAEAGLESVLRKQFGDAELKETLTDLLVTSYDIEARQTYYFRSWQAKKSASDNFLIRDVARATSAAPTFFAPALIEPVDGSRRLAMIDGGVFANNPTMCAFAEASRLHPIGEGNEEVRFVVVSLGTGVHTRPYRYDRAKHWGKVEWAVPILDIMFQGTGATVDYQIAEMLGEFKDPTRYYRFQGRLDDTDDDMDNASEGNIAQILKLARHIIDEHSQQIDNLCHWLKEGALSQAHLRTDLPPLPSP